ncbi:hypothetical protein AM10699_53730 [Acaryochloris marina MBIC10699]|nr:hypothetical protein AM10699_53730 [Acaryochloris marina MBIC10699]
MAKHLATDLHKQLTVAGQRRDYTELSPVVCQPAMTGLRQARQQPDGLQIALQFIDCEVSISLLQNPVAKDS